MHQDILNAASDKHGHAGCSRCVAGHTRQGTGHIARRSYDKCSTCIICMCQRDHGGAAVCEGIPRIATHTADVQLSKEVTGTMSISTEVQSIAAHQEEVHHLIEKPPFS